MLRRGALARAVQLQRTLAAHVVALLVQQGELQLCWLES